MKQEMEALVSEIEGCRILVAGDAVADIYLMGRISRISREAPVLVLEQEQLYDLWPPEVSGVLRQSLPPEEKMVRLHRMERGGAFGVLAGVLCDIAIGNPPMGFTILLTLVGLGVGWLGDSLMGRNFLTLVVLSTAVLLICAFFQTFRLFAFQHVPLGALSRTTLLQTAYSLFFTLPLAGLVNRSVARGG